MKIESEASFSSLRGASATKKRIGADSTHRPFQASHRMMFHQDRDASDSPQTIMIEPPRRHRAANIGPATASLRLAARTSPQNLQIPFALDRSERGLGSENRYGRFAAANATRFELKDIGEARCLHFRLIRVYEISNTFATNCVASVRPLSLHHEQCAGNAQNLGECKITGEYL